MIPPSEAAADPVQDADFFGRILEADLANVVRKAGSGKPLTTREREMIEAARSRMQTEPTEERWKLEGDGISSMERMTQREYAEVWGYSLRTVKNWIADGRAGKDPAPLARPADMPAWFARVYAPRDCPEKLAMAAQRILDGADIPKSSAAPVAMVERVEVAEGEKGLLAMLDRYRTAEVTLHAKYMTAIEAGDETRATFLMSEWSKMGEKCRSLEKAAPKALEEMGIFVRRDVVQRELGPLHGSVIKSFRQAFRVNRARLRLVETSNEWNRIVDGIVDEVSLMLSCCGFAEPLELRHNE